MFCTLPYFEKALQEEQGTQIDKKSGLSYNIIHVYTKLLLRYKGGLISGEAG
jgi:hypothetical protein